MFYTHAITLSFPGATEIDASMELYACQDQTVPQHTREEMGGASCGLEDCDYQCGKEQWLGLVQRVSTQLSRSDLFCANV